MFNLTNQRPSHWQSGPAQPNTRHFQLPVSERGPSSDESQAGLAPELRATRSKCVRTRRWLCPVVPLPSLREMCIRDRSTHRLRAHRVVNHRSLWTITKGAWQPIVDEDTFDRAQKQFENQTIHKTNAELLSGLQRLLEERGKLSEGLLNESPSLPSIQPYVRRFGSLSEAFEKIGYVGPMLTATRTRRILRALRDQIIAQVVATDPNRITLIQSDGHFRPRLRMLGLLVSVFLCRCSPNDESELRWIFNPVPGERKCVALPVSYTHLSPDL